MKKVIIPLFLPVQTALLLTIPAMATIFIDCQPTGNLLELEVTYDATSDGNVPRAFGLNITVDSGRTIDTLVHDSPDYWVHPGRILITDGNVLDEANSLAVVGSEGALGGLGTSGITVEMGSLYDEDDANHPNQPPLSGVLLTFTVSGDCSVTVAENTARGGVILENGKNASTNLPITNPQQQCGCLPYDHPDCAAFIARGMPTCWCNLRQCHGDAVGDKQGSTKKGYYYVGTTDLNVLIAAWTVKEPPDGSGIIGRTYTDGTLLICADFKHDTLGSSKKGYYYVGTTDLNQLIGYWTVKEPPKGSGVPIDCLDVP